MAAGIYIHIPFCIRKCHYCDFFSKAVDSFELRKSYSRALLQEIAFYGKKYGKNFKADSIFFGGGTPSLMEPELIDKILSSLRKNFDIAEDSEISMECNPATLTEEKLEGYKKAGVNRLSIGAQSFDDDVLDKLGRIHMTADIVDTVQMAREAGFDNINLDLMFSVPDLPVNQWKEVLKAALRLKPEHISLYSLEIVEGTEFWKRLKNGEMSEQLWSLDRIMYHEALKLLRKRGYHQYEISNVARPGMECKHNKKYWSLEEYMALGAGAHGYMGGVRYSNICNIEKYIMLMQGQDLYSDVTLGESDVYGAECIDCYHINTYKDNVSEYVFTALRTNDGVDFEDFYNKFENRFWDVYEEERDEFELYVKHGDAISDDSHIALTERGIDISNRIMAIFV